MSGPSFALLDHANLAGHYARDASHARLARSSASKQSFWSTPALPGMHKLRPVVCILIIVAMQRALLAGCVHHCKVIPRCNGHDLHVLVSTRIQPCHAATSSDASFSCCLMRAGPAGAPAASSRQEPGEAQLEATAAGQPAHDEGAFPKPPAAMVAQPPQLVTASTAVEVPGDVGQAALSLGKLPAGVMLVLPQLGSIGSGPDATQMALAPQVQQASPAATLLQQVQLAAGAPAAEACTSAADMERSAEHAQVSRATPVTTAKPFHSQPLPTGPAAFQPGIRLKQPIAAAATPTPAAEVATAASHLQQPLPLSQQTLGVTVGSTTQLPLQQVAAATATPAPLDPASAAWPQPGPAEVAAVAGELRMHTDASAQRTCDPRIPDLLKTLGIDSSSGDVEHLRSGLLRLAALYLQRKDSGTAALSSISAATAMLRSGLHAATQAGWVIDREGASKQQHHKQHGSMAVQVKPEVVTDGSLAVQRIVGPGVHGKQVQVYRFMYTHADTSEFYFIVDDSVLLAGYSFDSPEVQRSVSGMHGCSMTRYLCAQVPLCGPEGATLHATSCHAWYVAMMHHTTIRHAHMHHSDWHHEHAS